MVETRSLPEITIDQLTHSFYPLKHHWIQRGLSTFLTLLFLGAILIAPFKFVGGIIWLLAGWYLFRRDIQPLLQTHLEINQDALTGQVNGHKVYLFWPDVLVAQQTGSIKQGYIQLATTQATVTIPLQLFDGDRLWQLIKNCVPISALEINAYKRLPAYREHQQERARVIYTLSEPLRADYNLGIKLMAWGCLIFSVWVILKLFQEVGLSSSLLLPWAFFIGSSFAIYHFSKYIEISTSTVAVVSWLGRKEMNWAEIQGVKYHHKRWRITALTFFNNDRKLEVTGPVNWSGANVAKMVEFLEIQIEQYQIEIHQKEGINDI